MRTPAEQAQLEVELAIEFLKLFLEDLYIEECESSGSFQLEQPGDHMADALRYMKKAAQALASQLGKCVVI